jgi:ketosteroid isomerase-like protein
MSQENFDALRSVWPSKAVDLVELFNQPDAGPDFASAMSPDARVVFGPGDPGNRSYRGAEGLVEGWRDWLEPYAEYALEVEQFIDASEDRVVMLAKVRARTRRDAVLIEHSPAAVYELSNGMVTRIDFYLDRAEALEAVGLSE